MKASELRDALSQAIENHGDFHTQVTDDIPFLACKFDSMPYPCTDVLVIAAEKPFVGEYEFKLSFPCSKHFMTFSIDEKNFYELINYIRKENESE